MENQFKGSKGNWKVGEPGTVVTDDVNSILSIDKARGHAEIEYYGGVLICESVRKKADGRLIAAAPELLAALQDIVKWYGKRDVFEKLLPLNMQNEQIQNAIKAIEKALDNG